MKKFKESNLFYNEAIYLIDKHEYVEAIRIIKNNFNCIENKDDLALAYLICGFINDKLGDLYSAIDDFSASISYEKELDVLDGRSKDIAFSARSNIKYKNGDYEGAIKDKRNARRIRLLEVEKFFDQNNFKIDYKNILLGTFDKVSLEPKYNILIKSSKIEKRKYDLINDYKKVINKQKQREVIRELELISEVKFDLGDYKGSIKAIRRAEKYY